MVHHARACASARVSDGGGAFDQPFSCSDQATVLEVDQRSFGRRGFSSVVETHDTRTAWQGVFSFLARRAWLRPEPVFFRCHHGKLGVHPQQPGQARSLPTRGGLEVVECPVLSRRSPTIAASRLANHPRNAGRGNALTRPPNGTGKASGTQRQCHPAVRSRTL